MLKSKALMLALAITVLAGAGPLVAQLPGTWAGEGTGYCYPEPGVAIYPWQNWKGEIPFTQDVFKGEWTDADGNQGTFEGKPVPSIPEIAVFEGFWTWESPDGISRGGEFEMTFYFMSSEPPYCEGTWTSIWPSPGLPGTMKGWKVE